MKYFYSQARLPKDSSILSQIDSAAGRLYEKLTQLDLKRLNISEYNQNYWGGGKASLFRGTSATLYLYIGTVSS